jgi:hypothetical protein
MYSKTNNFKPNQMTTALRENDISFRYISLRAHKVPKVKQPALIWLDDRAKGGRGPSSYHQEFLSALFETAGAVFIIPNRITKEQEKKAYDAAVKTDCSVVVLTTPRCVDEWIQVSAKNSHKLPSST